MKWTECPVIVYLNGSLLAANLVWRHMKGCIKLAETKESLMDVNEPQLGFTYTLANFLG